MKINCIILPYREAQNTCRNLYIHRVLMYARICPVLYRCQHWCRLRFTALNNIQVSSSDGAVQNGGSSQRTAGPTAEGSTARSYLVDVDAVSVREV